MRSITVPALATAAAPARMVWLPGAYHGAQDFLAAGFSEAVRKRLGKVKLSELLAGPLPKPET